MSDSPTAKSKVMLAGRVTRELKKRFDEAARRRGWKTQLALERIVEQWLEAEERGRVYTGDAFNTQADRQAGDSMVHDVQPGESAEFKRGRRKSSKHERGAR